MHIPDKIYLQIKDEDGEELGHEVTWCVDKIHDTDIEYVRVTSRPQDDLVSQKDDLQNFIIPQGVG